MAADPLQEGAQPSAPVHACAGRPSRSCRRALAALTLREFSSCTDPTGSSPPVPYSLIYPLNPEPWCSRGAHRDLDLAEVIEQNVGGLEVVVDDVLRVDVGQPRRDLTCDGPCFPLRQLLRAGNDKWTWGRIRSKDWVLTRVNS